MAEGTIDTKTLRDMLGRGERVTSLAVQDTDAEVLKVRRTDKGWLSYVVGSGDEIKRSGEQPEYDVAELEAGSDRCATG